MEQVAQNDLGWEGTPVERRLLSRLPDILGLGADERLAIGSVRNTLLLDTAPPPTKPAPLLIPVMATTDGDRRALIEQVVNRSLQQLAIVRAWRELGTRGPPWSVLHGNALWNALVTVDIFDPQGLSDRMHAAAAAPVDPDEDPNAPWMSWRTGDATPTLLSRLRASRPAARWDGRPENPGSPAPR